MRTLISTNVTWFILLSGVTPLESILIYAPQASADIKPEDPRYVGCLPGEGIEHLFGLFSGLIFRPEAMRSGWVKPGE